MFPFGLSFYINWIETLAGSLFHNTDIFIPAEVNRFIQEADRVVSYHLAYLYYKVRTRIKR